MKENKKNRCSKVKKKKKTRCSDCGSTLTYRRISTNEQVCRGCGYIELIKEEK